MMEITLGLMAMAFIILVILGWAKLKIEALESISDLDHMMILKMLKRQGDIEFRVIELQVRGESLEARIALIEDWIRKNPPVKAIALEKES